METMKNDSFYKSPFYIGQVLRRATIERKKYIYVQRALNYFLKGKKRRGKLRYKYFKLACKWAKKSC